MRRRPRNRTVTECYRIKTRDDAAATFYCHIDREAIDANGAELGPVVGVRITYKHAKGSDLDAALLKISDLISREVQTVSVNKALQGRA